LMNSGETGLKRIGLALGGGGARGIAHIAYLKALSELGVAPSVISGTSSGAIAGALFAGGMNIEGMVAALQAALGGARQNAYGYFKRIETKAGGIVSSVAKKHCRACCR